MNDRLHKVQMSILQALRHAEAAHFGALMRPTGLESDTFKFHVRKLVKLGYIEKLEYGPYQLTATGKEFANNLDEVRLRLQRQPKLSVIVLISRPSLQGQPLYLFQQRRRNPFFGFWSGIGGPVQWGEDIEETAVRELGKQTGLTAVCEVQSFYRQRDYDKATSGLLEDKLFAILEATDVRGEMTNSWHGGYNEWMTAEDYRQQPKHFSTVYEAIKMLSSGKSYVSGTADYDQDDY